MADLPPVRHLLQQVPQKAPYAQVVLTYDERLIRRKRVTTSGEESFLVDLPEVTNLDLFWGFELEDGRAIEVVNAAEQVLLITGPDLARYAWHIGNRHTPCQVEQAQLIIRADHVLEAMLRQLGAQVQPAEQPFSPEVGAYGTGRPMGHDHGADHTHSHAHKPHAHKHSHDHAHHHHHAHGDKG